MIMTNFVQEIRSSSRKIVRGLGLLQQESEYEVSLSPRHLLIELDDKGPLTNTQLVLLLNLDKSTISRMTQTLAKQNLITRSSQTKDQRFNTIELTSTGKQLVKKINNIANEQVKMALQFMSDQEHNILSQGLSIYAKALERSSMLNQFNFRPVHPQDNTQLRRLIKKCLTEFGANCEGFAFVDPDLKDISQHYQQSGFAYLVIERITDKKIVGGGGFGPLLPEDHSICELKKMYLSSEVRGYGLGNILLQTLLTKAKGQGYKQCYLETLASMEKANKLYDKFGFTILKKPLGNTGHFGCDRWYLKEL